MFDREPSQGHNPVFTPREASEAGDLGVLPEKALADMGEAFAEAKREKNISFADLSSKGLTTGERKRHEAYVDQLLRKVENSHGYEWLTVALETDIPVTRGSTTAFNPRESLIREVTALLPGFVESSRRSKEDPTIAEERFMRVHILARIEKLRPGRKAGTSLPRKSGSYLSA